MHAKPGGEVRDIRAQSQAPGELPERHDGDQREGWRRATGAATVDGAGAGEADGDAVVKYLWQQPDPPQPEKKPKRVIEDVVIGKHFFADEESSEEYAGQFNIWSGDIVAFNRLDGNGPIFRAWNREQAVKIVEFLDSVVDHQTGKKDDKS